MNRSIRIAVTMGCLLLSACALRSSPTGLVIADVTVVSPERAAPLEHAYVRIVDGRIAEVSGQRLRGAEEIDGKGRFLIPGLIDSHVHLALAPGFPAPMTAEQATAHPDIVAAALEQDPKSFLFFGFTTVVDLVGTPERTAQWNARAMRPDAYFCSAAVVVDGQIRRVPYPFFSYAVTPSERFLPIDSVATPRAIIARMKAEGAACLKTIYDVGFTPTVEQIKPLIDAARERDLPVFIHANRKRAQAFAVAAGVDAIVHGMWRDANEDAALDIEAREVLAAIGHAKIGYQPTTQVIASQFDVTQRDFLQRPAVADAYPASLIGLYASDEGPAAMPRWARTAGDAFRTRIKGTLSRATEVTRILAQADAHLLFGSDTPSDFIHTNPPGLNGRLEMDHWVAAGVSLQKLFHALTIDNARMLRLQDELGTIEPGKTANLLLLRADPLQSVAAYDSIETVVLHGRPIVRSALSARNAPPAGT